MTEDELKSHLATCWYAMAGGMTVAPSWIRSLDAIASELKRLRSELASERATHQELWKLVDRELDRIYCDAKGIERSEG